MKTKTKNLLLGIAIGMGFSVATVAQNVPNYVPTNGLVGWWPFNGNANDESGNNNNGTVNGATLNPDRFGNPNTAYFFDGVDDFIDLTNKSIAIQSNNSRTISCWVYSGDMTIGDYRIVSTGSATTNGSFNLVKCNGNYIGIMGFNNDIYPNNSYFLNDSLWYNLIVTYSNDTVKTYINGMLDITAQLSINTIGQNNYFGKSNHSVYPSYVYGLIDDIGIWNRALTQQEISDLYNGNICYQNITVTDTLIINTNLVGFNPVTYQNSIKIFPNPTNDHITINYGNYATLNNYQLRITNSLGQQMFQTTINQQSSYINLSNWTGNGIYFVHLIDPQGNTIDIRKIVLQ
jgi:hypothetical protein